MKATIKSRRGARINNADAVSIRRYIMATYGQMISAEQFVDDARRKRSPLRRYITTDAVKAHYEFNLQEARNILRSIVVEIEDDDGAKSQLNVFHNFEVRGTDGATTRTYATVDTVVGDAKMRRQVIEDLRQRMQVIERIMRAHEKWLGGSVVRALSGLLKLLRSLDCE